MMKATAKAGSLHTRQARAERRGRARQPAAGQAPVPILQAGDVPERRRLPFRALLETGHQFTTDSHDSEAARRGGDAPRQTDEDKSRAADHPEIYTPQSRVPVRGCQKYQRSAG